MFDFVSVFFLFSINLAIFALENTTVITTTRTKLEIEPEFLPIGKDANAPKVLNVNVTRTGKTQTTKDVWKDGIKYTEIVRQTPLGGIQTTHVEGGLNHKPSILPRPLSNFGNMINTFRSNMNSRNDRISNNGFDYPHYPRVPEGFNPRDEAYGGPRLEGLLSRLGLMTGRILDGVAEFLYRQ